MSALRLECLCPCILLEQVSRDESEEMSDSQHGTDSQFRAAFLSRPLLGVSLLFREDFFFSLQHCVRRFTTSMTVDTGGYSSCQGTDPAAVAPHLWLWDSPICPIRNTKRLCFQDQCRIEVKVQVMLSTLLKVASPENPMLWLAGDIVLSPTGSMHARDELLGK